MFGRIRKSLSSVKVKKKPKEAKSKNIKKEFYDALTVALCSKSASTIDDVASYLTRNGVMSENKEEHLWHIKGSFCKAKFLVDVVYAKGESAISSLYEATKEYELWDAADAMKPLNAPHGSHLPPLNSSLDFPDGKAMSQPPSRKKRTASVTFSDMPPSSH